MSEVRLLRRTTIYRGAVIRLVRDVLEHLRFGSITLTVHDARVVQIDVTEKTRLTA